MCATGIRGRSRGNGYVATSSEESVNCDCETTTNVVTIYIHHRLLDAAIARAEAAEKQLRDVDEEAKEAGDSMDMAAATVQTTLECLVSCITSSKAAGLRRAAFAVGDCCATAFIPNH